VVALFVVDTVPMARAGHHRRRLLAAHLHALDARLREQGGSLLVRRGDPAVVVAEVAHALAAARVHVNADVSGYARRRDDAVAAALGPDRLVAHWGNLVQPPGSVTTGSTGRAHRVFTPFFRAWSALAVPEVPGPGDAEVVHGAATPGAEDLPTPGERSGGPAEEGGGGDRARPRGELSAAGGEVAAAGGEVAAEDRLRAWLAHVDGYKDTRDLPADAEGTSHLSADLRFGTLSPRHVLEVVGADSPGRAAFCRQLAWRDWYAHLFAEEPRLAREAMKPEMDRVAWRDDQAGLEAWKEGRTGYPFVDAGMRQLAATGWMHNRVRMVAASFLVKDLLVDWRHGEEHFARLLVDFEVSQNAGNWQWVAGTGPDAAPYFRVFNPVTQGRRFDPEGDYVRRWVPELAGLPGASVHAPWELGPLELAAAGVVPGDTYPDRLVDHAEARDRAIAAYDAARA
jgi:deoxyribodipyrimidine photo-lyase